jgi:hypothetical protein
MPRISPRYVLCVLGIWPDFAEVRSTAGLCGFELDTDYSQLEPDERMASAFRASFDRVAPTMSEEDWQGVREHSAVAYLLSPPVGKDTLEVAFQALMLITQLLENGGLAAKCESSGIAHGRSRWLQLGDDLLAASTAGDLHGSVASLIAAFVRRPLSDAGVLYSCGMHLLGMPDVEVQAVLDPFEAVQWIDLLALYLLADRPSRPVLDGDGFRLADDGPRRVMRLLPCWRYQEDDFFFNPYGYVRLEGGSS